MKLEKSLNDEVEDALSVIGEDEDELESSIDASSSNLIFDMFSKHLYSNPIGSIIREIASNAIDAHRQAGKEEEPVLIKLGYDDDEKTYYVEFTDYGHGLTPEEMKTIYINWFKSTRRESNKYLGMFGIGSKSPFAYRDYYKLISSTDGIRREYIYRKTEEGKPKLSLLFEEDETREDEEGNLITGVTVRIDLKEERDLEKFLRNMQIQLKYFDTVYVDHSEINSYTLNRLSYKNDFTIIDEGTYRFREDLQDISIEENLSVTIGNVVYPIDFSELNMKPIRIAASLTSDVGKISVTPSRESIRYNESTKEYLKELIQKFISELEPKVEEALATYSPLDFYANEDVLSACLSNGLELSRELTANRRDESHTFGGKDVVESLGRDFFAKFGIRKLKTDPLFFLDLRGSDGISYSSLNPTTSIQKHHYKHRFYPNEFKTHLIVNQRAKESTPTKRLSFEQWFHNRMFLETHLSSQMYNHITDSDELLFANVNEYAETGERVFDYILRKKKAKVIYNYIESKKIVFLHDPNKSIAKRLHEYMKYCLDLILREGSYKNVSTPKKTLKEYREIYEEYSKKKAELIKQARQEGKDLTVVYHHGYGERSQSKTTIEHLLAEKSLLIHGNLDDQEKLDLVGTREFQQFISSRGNTVIRVSRETSKLIQERVKCSIHVNDLLGKMNPILKRLSTTLMLIEEDKILHVCRKVIEDGKINDIKYVNNSLYHSMQLISNYVNAYVPGSDSSTQHEFVRNLTYKSRVVADEIKALCKENNFYDEEILIHFKRVKEVIIKAPLLPALLEISNKYQNKDAIADYLKKSGVKVNIIFYQTVSTRIKLDIRDLKRRSKLLGLPSRRYSGFEPIQYTEVITETKVIIDTGYTNTMYVTMPSRVVQVVTNPYLGGRIAKYVEPFLLSADATQANFTESNIVQDVLTQTSSGGYEGGFVDII